MAALVQSAPQHPSFTNEPTRHHDAAFYHHRPHQFRKQQSIQPSYTAAVPEEQFADESSSGVYQSNIFKQINIIPGLDPSNAIVDTGVKLVRPTGGHVQVSANTQAANEFDGKRMRRSIQRRTVDYNASTIQLAKHRLYRRSILQTPTVQPDPLYYIDMIQPQCLLHNPINSVTTRFVRASTNKVRCPVFTVAWTPEGRRVVTGTSSGEFTLWNGLTFNFETILQAHESSVRAMEWSHNDQWLLSGDHNGIIKYWQSNMNQVKMIQAHTDPIRGVSFCPTDNKFSTCADDGLVKIWDFYRCVEERTLKGHGADVKCLGWHPTKSMVASGSKDSQQPLKLWDPKAGMSLATIHGHKSTVMDLHWNRNGNWLLTGSRDRLVKVFDIRMMKEIFTFRGHKKEAASVNWHPLYEEMLVSGGSDGSIMFWLIGCEKELGVMENAHDGMIWDLKWHPLGHILCSGANDHTTKFWTRNRPGDKMRDRYNLNILPAGYEDDYEYELPNSSQSELDTTCIDSSLNASLDTSNVTPGKDAVSRVRKTSLQQHEAIQISLQQASLSIAKPAEQAEAAQVFTLPNPSQLRATAPSFKIDVTKQREVIAELQRGDKDSKEGDKTRRKRRKEGEKREGRRKRNASERRDSIGDDDGAPALLSMELSIPDSIRDHDQWDNPDYVEPDSKRREHRNDDQRIPTGSNDRFEGNEMPFDGRPHPGPARFPAPDNRHIENEATTSVPPENGDAPMAAPQAKAVPFSISAMLEHAKNIASNEGSSNNNNENHTNSRDNHSNLRFEEPPTERLPRRHVDEIPPEELARRVEDVSVADLARAARRQQERPRREPMQQQHMPENTDSQFEPPHQISGPHVEQPHHPMPGPHHQSQDMGMQGKHGMQQEETVYEGQDMYEGQRFEEQNMYEGQNMHEGQNMYEGQNMHEEQNIYEGQNMYEGQYEEGAGYNDHNMYEGHMYEGHGMGEQPVMYDGMQQEMDAYNEGMHDEQAMYDEQGMLDQQLMSEELSSYHREAQEADQGGFVEGEGDQEVDDDDIFAPLHKETNLALAEETPEDNLEIEHEIEEPSNMPMMTLRGRGRGMRGGRPPMTSRGRGPRMGMPRPTGIVGGRNMGVRPMMRGMRPPGLRGRGNFPGQPRPPFIRPRGPFSGPPRGPGGPRGGPRGGPGGPCGGPGGPRGPRWGPR